MRIEIRVARGRETDPQARLARRLEQAGHAARFAIVDPPGPGVAGIALLMAFEDLVYGPVRRGPSGAPGANGFDGPPDLVIDLADGREADAVQTLFPMFDGLRGQSAAIAAALDGRAPRTIIALAPGDGSLRECARGLAAIPNPHRFGESLDRIHGRMIDLAVQAVARLARSPAPPPLAADAAPIQSSPSALAPAVFVLGALAGRVTARLQKLSGGGETWRVAWRRTRGDGVQQTLAWPEAAYNLLPDDGARYYADPFVFERGGEIHVFVEEFPFATGRGIISAFTISPDGVATAPRPVLEAPYHLSYPLVFERGGGIYMMPETGAAGRLELYRAERFPDVWVKDRTLIDNIAAADATLLEHDDLLWIFASVGEDGQSDWDSLALFSSPTLDGPWRPHPRNPVLIDAAQSRCAGHLFERGGRLFRPAQDCSRYYGSALTLCAIDRLDEEGFAQTIAARLETGGAGGHRGVHTLNEAAGIEAIDLLGSRDATAAPVAQFVNQASSQCR